MSYRTFVIPPIARRLLGAAALCAGVFVAGGQLKGSAPRDVVVRVSLRDFARAGVSVRAVDLTFLRGEAPLRALHRNLSSTPTELRETMSLAEGTVRARVSVTLDGQVLERESEVTVVSGAELEVAAPGLP